MQQSCVLGVTRGVMFGASWLSKRSSILLFVRTWIELLPSGATAPKTLLFSSLLKTMEPLAWFLVWQQ
jgi:hypothetical protein